MSRGQNDKKKERKKVETFQVPSSLDLITENIIITNKITPKISTEELFKQASKYHVQGNISKAAKYYQLLINQGFEDHRVFSNYSLILKSFGKLIDAELSTRKAISLKPDFAEAHLNLGIILMDIEKFKDAELSLRKAIELKPHLAEAHSNLGIILMDQDNLVDAELSTRKAIELKPNFAEAHSNLGKILKDHGNLKDAELSLRKAIVHDPNFAEAHLNLGILLMDITNLKDAELSLRKAISLNPLLSKAHTNLALILKYQGNIQEAELSARKAIELKPNFCEANSNLGSILLDLDKLEEAEKYTRKAIEINSYSTNAHITLGEILFNLDKPKEASISDWNAIKLDPSFSFLQSYRENAKIINKTAFYIYSLTVFNHFKPIIEINPSFFDILVNDNMEEEIIRKVRYLLKSNIKIRKINDLVKNNLIYEKLVSNLGDHKYKFNENKNNLSREIILPTIKLAGKKNIRVMYSAGKNKYTISSYWNKYYDQILCYGPYHADRFRKRHQISTAQMGYPRFDKYFNPGFERDYLIKKFKCNPRKKTIVWLPTWEILSSIDKYHKAISSLKVDHNIVVRPHPSMKSFYPEYYKKLFSVDLNYVDEEKNEDNVQLYSLADLMLFDYGGPMFGALYLNKNFAFLEMDTQSKYNSRLGRLSSEDYIKSFFPERIAKVESLNYICNYCLKNPPSNSIMKLLQDEFFNTNYQGTSGKKAYELITSDKLLK